LDYVKDATVKVKLLSYKVTVGGEVKNPGIYYNYNKSINIFEALNLANGFTDYANVRKVLIVRTLQDGTKSIRVDLAQKGMMESEAYYLLPNDIIYVEADKFKSFNLNVTAWTMFLSAITTVLLVYEVFNP
jgi:polysaccharide export outer membrane protein